jgi:hypothetical protein
MAYTTIMVGPSTKPKRTARKEPIFAPHPDDEADILEGIREAERGEALSAEESAEYVRALAGADKTSGK